MFKFNLKLVLPGEKSSLEMYQLPSEKRRA